MCILSPCYRMCIVLAVGGTLLVANATYAKQPGQPPHVVASDATLDPSGVWRGVIVTPDGRPFSHAAVELVGGGLPPSKHSTITDERGSFEFKSVRPGTYLLHSGDDVQVYRLWQFGTAPPYAKPHDSRGALVVAGDAVTRGKYYDWMSSRPALFYTGVAAAIAVPIAVIGSSESKPDASN